MRPLFSICLGLFLLTACDALPVLSGEKAGPLQAELELQSESIESIHHLQAEYTVTNVSESTVRYGFGDSCQHRVLVRQGVDIVIESMNISFCLMTTTTLELDPGESKSYPVTFRMLSHDSILGGGEYQLTAFLENVEHSDVSASFSIE